MIVRNGGYSNPKIRVLAQVIKYLLETTWQLNYFIINYRANCDKSIYYIALRSPKYIRKRTRN